MRPNWARMDTVEHRYFIHRVFFFGRYGFKKGFTIFFMNVPIGSYPVHLIHFPSMYIDALAQRNKWACMQPANIIKHGHSELNLNLFHGTRNHFPLFTISCHLNVFQYRFVPYFIYSKKIIYIHIYIYVHNNVYIYIYIYICIELLYMIYS